MAFMQKAAARNPSSFGPRTPPDQDTSNDFQKILPRVLPFAAYMGFLAIGSLNSWLGGESEDAAQTFDLWLYPVKILVVGVLLFLLWSRCEELKNPIILNFGEGLLALGAGLVVYALWVRMDWSWATQGEMVGYNPFLSGATVGTVLAGIRIFGASIIVPVMEELFWRSFLIRYVMNSRFYLVPLGTFSIASCAITVILFGLEHHLWLAGMMAGAVYNLLLYHTKRLWSCIVAHSVTNFALGIHVLMTAEWQWW